MLASFVLTLGLAGAAVPALAGDEDDATQAALAAEAMTSEQDAEATQDATPAQDSTPATDGTTDSPVTAGTESIDESDPEDPAWGTPVEAVGDGAQDSDTEANGSEAAAPSPQAKSAATGESPNAVAPMAAGPDGGSAPYLYWDVRDTDGVLVGGATFRLEHRSWSLLSGWSWQDGSGANGLEDCQGNCGGSTSRIDRDGDAGEFLAQRYSTSGNNSVQVGDNYQLTPIDPPAGYAWVSTSSKTIGNANGNNGTWNNGNGNQTHDFGTFQVEKKQTMAICEAGYIYGVTGSGQLVQIDSTGTKTNIGAPASGVSSFNGLGIGSGGEPIFAYERYSNQNDSVSVSRATIWEYSTSTGQWTSTGDSINTNASSRSVQLVGGAVNLYTGNFFLGGFTSNGNNFGIWEYNATSGAFAYKGQVSTPGGASGNNETNNGDIAFDANGNLFIVRGVGSTTTVFSVTAADLTAANGGNIPRSASSSVSNTTSNVNGAAFDSSGRAFLGSDSQLRSYAMPNWSGSNTVVSSSLGTTDLASCSSPPTITIEKFVEDGRVNPSDEFKLTLTQGSQTIGEATTSGPAVGLQDDRIGPVPTVRGVALTFSETAVGSTNLANYASSYRCLVDGVQDHSASGNGTSGTITIPPGGQEVVCRFHNSPLVANLTIHKDVTDVNGDNPTARPNWSVGATASATAGTVTKTPVSNTQQTNAAGDASWTFKFNAYSSRATVSVSETMQTGYEFRSGQCTITALDGSTRDVALDGAAAKNLTGIGPGDDISCTYTNKPLPGSVIWSKVDSDGGALLGGSEWQLTGPGTSGPTVTITDCDEADAAECTGADKDPAAGQFKLTGLAWGEYTVVETQAPDGYVGTASFTFTIDANNAGTIISKGAVSNTRATASATWSKTDADGGALLAGSEWTITGPGYPSPGTLVTDCVETSAALCTGLDKDPIAGQFKLDGLAWGDYTVEETTAPTGYTGAASFEFTIDSDTGVVLEYGEVTNTRIPGTVTWSKVNDSGDALNGSEWKLIGPGGSELAIQDCVATSPGQCVGPDVDPSAGGFKIDDLVWGDYTLIETKAPPGYQLIDTEYTFTISAENLGQAFGDIVNDQQAGPDLPLTGGLGRDHVYIAGALVLLLSLTTYGATKLQRRRSQRSVS